MSYLAENIQIRFCVGGYSYPPLLPSPLLQLPGTIRSAFLMTEPAVASSDATNIACSVHREGGMYVINGRKWWSSGAMDPRCKVCGVWQPMVAAA